MFQPRMESLSRQMTVGSMKETKADKAEDEITVYSEKEENVKEFKLSVVKLLGKETVNTPKWVKNDNESSGSEQCEWL